jgi:hypothetical protein
LERATTEVKLFSPRDVPLLSEKEGPSLLEGDVLPFSKERESWPLDVELLLSEKEGPSLLERDVLHFLEERESWPLDVELLL